jgi:hypothetical protein
MQDYILVIKFSRIVNVSKNNRFLYDRFLIIIKKSSYLFKIIEAPLTLYAMYFSSYQWVIIYD